jgi:hypothetical protein
MKDKNNEIWTWPEALDALTAAPQQHKLLFENETVRVIDTLIPPNEITELHTHKWPASLYILSWSDFVRFDDINNVVVDSRTFQKTPQPSTALWTEPLIPHKLENVGKKDIHVISVEIKGKLYKN